MATRSDLLQKRLGVFGLSACKLARRLPRDFAAAHITRQLVRCATAPGALYSEARDAESNTDYIHKVKLCVKELRESDYWLAMATGYTDGSIKSEGLSKECHELTAIFVTCLKRARSHDGTPDAKPKPRGEREQG